MDNMDVWLPPLAFLGLHLFGLGWFFSYHMAQEAGARRD